MALYRYHTADYRTLLRQIDGTEMNRVLSYWRAGYYIRNPLGFDGYSSSSTLEAGIVAALHSADYQAPFGQIDSEEIAVVQSYWRSGGYHVNPDGYDGYSYNRSGIGPRFFSAGANLGVLSGPVVQQSGPADYNPGATLTITNTFFPTSDKLLSLYWRMQLPSGWSVVDVTGDGGPVLNGNDILLTAMTLPSTPISIVCRLQVPLTETRACDIQSYARYLSDGMIRSASMTNSPLMVTALDNDVNGMADSWESAHAEGSGSLDPNADLDGDGLNNQAEYLCGTIPTNAASVLQMFALKMMPDQTTHISWSSSPGRIYTLQRAEGAPIRKTSWTFKRASRPIRPGVTRIRMGLITYKRVFIA